jgi:CheY-like chemotaxis protein
MTSVKHSLSVLLVNDHAEEIKVISTTLRGFFPDCRVEAVYTPEDALQWSLREDWHLLLVDDALSPRSGVEILGELKRNSPHAAISCKRTAAIPPPPFRHSSRERIFSYSNTRQASSPSYCFIPKRRSRRERWKSSLNIRSNAIFGSLKASVTWSTNSTKKGDSSM